MKTVIIGFSKAKSKWAIFSKAICWAQGTPFSHVYTRVTWPSSGQDIVYQASGTKVNCDSYSHFLLEEEVVDEFSFDVDPETWNKVAAFMVAQLGKPYSIKEILGLAIRIAAFKIGFKIENPIYEGSSAYVCSILGSDMVELMDPSIKLDNRNIAPKELYDALVEYKIKKLATV